MVQIFLNLQPQDTFAPCEDPITGTENMLSFSYHRQAYNDTAIFTGSAARRQSNTTKHDNRCDTASPTCHTDCIHGPICRACTLQNRDLQQNDMPDRGRAIFPPHVSARICPMTRSNNITCFRALLHFLLHLQS